MEKMATTATTRRWEKIKNRGRWVRRKWEFRRVEMRKRSKLFLPQRIRVRRMCSQMRIIRWETRFDTHLWESTFSRSRARRRTHTTHTHTLLSSPKVDFCGYTVPHPMEPKMNLRLQTKDGFDATEVMKESLDVLVDIFDVVDKKFQKASKAFKPSS